MTSAVVEPVLFAFVTSANAAIVEESLAPVPMRDEFHQTIEVFVD